MRSTDGLPALLLFHLDAVLMVLCLQFMWQVLEGFGYCPILHSIFRFNLPPPSPSLEELGSMLRRTLLVLTQKSCIGVFSTGHGCGWASTARAKNAHAGQREASGELQAGCHHMDRQGVGWVSSLF